MVDMWHSESTQAKQLDRYELMAAILELEGTGLDAGRTVDKATSLENLDPSTGAAVLLAHVVTFRLLYPT